MFLSLFPFPEVASIIAICLAWVFIALGVMGNNNAAQANVSSNQSETQAQVSVYQVQKSIVFSDRTYFWQQIVNYCIADKNEEPLLCYSLHTEIIKFPIKQEHFPKYCLYKNIPNRAPPVV